VHANNQPSGHKDRRQLAIIGVATGTKRPEIYKKRLPEKKVSGLRGIHKANSDLHQKHKQRKGSLCFCEAYERKERRYLERVGGKEESSFNGRDDSSKEGREKMRH